MRKYIVAIINIIRADKWMVVSINKLPSKDRSLKFVSNKIDTHDSISIANEIKEMTFELITQEWAVDEANDILNR